MNTELTTVVFRTWRDVGTVLALFPYEIEERGLCSSYEHVGQHGSADYQGCIARTRPSKPAEFASLKRELEGIGYKLSVRLRRTR